VPLLLSGAGESHLSTVVGASASRGDAEGLNLSFGCHVSTGSQLKIGTQVVTPGSRYGGFAVIGCDRGSSDSNPTTMVSKTRTLASDQGCLLINPGGMQAIEAFRPMTSLTATPSSLAPRDSRSPFPQWVEGLHQQWTASTLGVRSHSPNLTQTYRRPKCWQSFESSWCCLCWRVATCLRRQMPTRASARLGPKSARSGCTTALIDR
jgi:hypothetical protein